MLPSTLREKRHYLAIELLSKDKISPSEAKRAILISITNFLGSSEAAKAGPQILEINFNYKNRFGFFAAQVILSVNRKSVLKVKAALTLLKEIDGKQAMTRVKGVSGTLRKLREKFL